MAAPIGVSTLSRAKGTLSIVPVVIMDAPASTQSVRIFGTMCNRGASTRLINIVIGGIYVWFGDATNSPLKAGQTLEIDLRLQILPGDTIQAYQTAGADVDYFLTMATVPA